MSTISNSDLEMAGLLMLWLAIEGVCNPLQEKCITLFCNNSPSIGWATCLVSKRSMVAEHLVQALAMCFKIQRACPLTPMHIHGKRNAIADITLRSFGSNPPWKCKTGSDLLTLFNSMFHLPNQQPWTVFHLNCELVTRMTSALQMKPFELDDWGWLPKVRRHVGDIGAHTSNLREWIRTYSTHCSRQESGASQGLQHETRSGYYGWGRKGQISTVTSAITDIGQTITLACNNNTTKVNGSDIFLPTLQVMIEGYNN